MDTVDKQRMARADIERIAAARLKDHPLGKENAVAFVRGIPGGWFIRLKNNIARDLSVFEVELNVFGGVCYLLDIWLMASLRGKGHGAALYDVCVNIARDLGCKRIEQAPSGSTPSGESRGGWLNRRGWTLGKEGCTTIAYKELKNV